MTGGTRDTPLLDFLNRLAAFVRSRTGENTDSITFVLRRCHPFRIRVRRMRDAWVD